MKLRFWKKLRVQVHFLHCKHCHSYHHKNQKLKELKKHELKLLSKTEKEEFKTRLSFIEKSSRPAQIEWQNLYKVASGQQN